MFVIVLTIFPFYTLWFMFKTKEEELLHDKYLKSKQGSIYENLKIKNKAGMLYYWTFMMRRFSMAFILVFANAVPWF